MMGGGLFNTALKGTGWVAILSDGPPVLLNVAAAPTFADAQAAITWSQGVTTALKTDFKMKNLIGKGSGESVQMAFRARAGCSCSRPRAGSSAAVVLGRRLRRPALGNLARRAERRRRAYFIRKSWVEMTVDPHCPVCLTADIVCGKWTLLAHPRPRGGPLPLLRARALA